MSDTVTDPVAGSSIDSVEVSAFTVPTDAPEADGTISWDSTTMVLVRARSGDVEGIGWTYGPTACATVVRAELADLVVGRNAMDVAGSFQAMVRSVRNAGRGGIAGYAISAVDVALWDLKARLLGLPLHHLLGAVSATVPVYGSGGFTTYDEQQLRHQLGDWVLEQRIPRVKIKIGESWGTTPERDLARMRQARDVIGESTELFVDANGGYTRKEAIRVMSAATDLDVHWFEEPVSSDDLAGLHEVRDNVAADVAAGEYGDDLHYFRRMCAAGAVDCLQADASRCGGITEFVRVAAVAASFGLEVSGHCAPHLHAHVAAATPNLRHLEWFHDHVRVESLFFDGTLDPTGGTITPDPETPGHGLTLRVADAERYRVA
ncbi:enolase C-terminal domain-like protein [Knoellia sp. Soil729]|uniref:enolase C-terminal domain-like protein n=1 Tax=Knoellia sp. Soil729 TaxID=1736394 RepID=UPI0006FB3072|nr:enolase C-terminal domain-like protein [Knoellia sp. Soil729]KRE41574.1 mandelate racemase [Knoellia sp. Soil729]